MPSRPFWNVSDWHPGEGGHGSAGRGRSRGRELHKIVQRVSINRESQEKHFENHSSDAFGISV